MSVLRKVAGVLRGAVQVAVPSFRLRKSLEDIAFEHWIEQRGRGPSLDNRSEVLEDGTEIRRDYSGYERAVESYARDVYRVINRIVNHISEGRCVTGVRGEKSDFRCALKESTMGIKYVEVPATLVDQKGSDIERLTPTNHPTLILDTYRGAGVRGGCGDGYESLYHRILNTKTPKAASNAKTSRAA